MIIMSRIIMVGTDGPYYYIGADGKLHRFPGWEPDKMKDLSHSLAALHEISQVKTPGLERVVATLHEAVTKEVSAHLQAGDVLVLR